MNNIEGNISGTESLEGQLNTGIAYPDLRHYYNKDEADALLDEKVDKVTGKGLSTEDYTTAEKNKLSGVESGAEVNIIETVKVNGTSQTVSNKAVDITVPTHLSDLAEDNTHKTVTDTEKSTWNNKIDNTVNNLLNYYAKSETFTKQEVNNLISAITTMDMQVVQELPTQDISTTTIYLVPKTTAETNNAYDEYIYISNSWEFIGSTEVDLTDYVKNTDYASDNTAGVIKVKNNYGLYISSSGELSGRNITYSQYENANNLFLISKAVLENVIAGKGLTTKAYVDGLVGDIDTILETLTVGNGV